MKVTYVSLAVALCLPVVLLADDAAPEGSEGKSPLTFTVDFTTGVTSTFQMPLGGSFGKGPDLLDAMTASVSNTFRDGDSFSLFGWNQTDLPSTTADWQGALLYNTRLLQRGRNTLSITGGVQRWLLPNVASGAKDWLLSGNLTYGTNIKNVPLFISENSWSLLKSTLPTGSAIYTRVYTQHSLLKRQSFQLLLRQGPAHSYSWGFYGLEGNCVLHYEGSLVAIWKGNTFDGTYRQQFGLQDGVPNAHYWEFAFSRQLLKLAQQR